MDYQNFLLDAIEVVLAWNTPDEDFPQAVNCLMAGINSEDIYLD